MADTDAVGSKIQEEAVGITLAVHLEPEVTTSRLLLDEDNISTSAVSEFGPEVDHNQEDTGEEKLDSDMLDRVPLKVTGVQITQLALATGTQTSVIEEDTHVPTPQIT